MICQKTNTHVTTKKGASKCLEVLMPVSIPYPNTFPQEVTTDLLVFPCFYTLNMHH